MKLKSQKLVQKKLNESSNSKGVIQSTKHTWFGVRGACSLIEPPPSPSVHPPTYKGIPLLHTSLPTPFPFHEIIKK